MGKSAKIIDKSMAAIGTVFKEEEEGKVQQEEGVDDNASRDLTDLDNEDFIYVYWFYFFVSFVYLLMDSSVSVVGILWAKRVNSGFPALSSLSDIDT